jgi:hypothetical protein
MVNALESRRGEGYIRTAVAAIIAVVIGAVIVAGCYLLFAGKNGIIKNVGTKIDLMLADESVVVSRTYSDGRYIIQYSLDSENWKDADIPGFDEMSSATNLVDNGNGDSQVWLVSFTSSSRAYVCSSTNGISWTPIFSDSRSITLTKSGSTIYVQCYDGRSYKSTDGINWTMTSTKSY